MKGCMKMILGGGIMSIVIIGACLAGCIGIAVLVALSQDAQTKDAIEANAGRGTMDNPIPAGETVTFTDHFSVEVLDVMRPANAEVERMNQFNETPAAGTDYVLIRFRMTCLQSGSDACNGFDLKVRIVDDAGNEWGEPTLIMLSPSLDSQESIAGNTVEGYKGFEFPTSGTMESLKMWVTGGATLYSEIPG